MRITFNCSTTETLEYLRLMSQVLRNNQTVSDEVKAYKALKELVVSLDDRLAKVEAERRNRVCR